jgi:UDP-N-acetylmuramoylalanine--D-glutamate ligase
MINKWLVIGAGVSGLGAAKLLRKRGLGVRVSDAKSLPEAKAKAFRALGAELCDGGHAVSHLDGIDAVVASPGLPATHPLLTAARARGLPIVTEIDLALESFSGRLVAVTGTNGKSTTCALLGHVLAKAGASVSVGGNFGDPPTAMLAEERMGDVLVLELSSYQLEGSDRVRPDVAIFTSFSHDHMARHGSMEGYLAAKWRVFDQGRPQDLALIPHWIAELGKRQGLELRSPCLRFFANLQEMRDAALPGFTLDGETLVLQDGERVSLEDASLKESHNLLNAAFSLLALRQLCGVPLAKSSAFLRDFRGLPHRCELVGHHRGRPIVNDSKSTNVESTLVALKSQVDPVVLLMGGQGKGEPYTPILEERSRIAALVTFGASEGEIARDLERQLPTYRFKTLNAALEELPAIVGKHEAGVLFSPGCASFDEFDNYEHRGDVFRKAIQKSLLILIA